MTIVPNLMFAFGYRSADCSKTNQRVQKAANDPVSKDASFVSRRRREIQILRYYYKIMFGTASPTLQPLTSKTVKYLSP